MKRIKPLLVTLLVIGLASTLKATLNQAFKIDSPILLFYSAITICALYGGALQGFVAMLLALVASRWFVTIPEFLIPIWDRVYLIRTSLFIFDSSLLIILCTVLHRSRQKARDAAAKASEADLILRASEARFRGIFESNMIGLLFSDGEGRVVEANDYFLQLSRFRSADVKNGSLTWKNLTPPEYETARLRAEEEFQVNACASPMEGEILTKSGIRVPVLIGSAVFDRDKKVSFVLDISQRKCAEDALAEAKALLEDRVEKRTLQLSQANSILHRVVADREAAVEALRQSEHFLDTIIENIPNMIFIKAAESLRFVRFNRAGETLLGYGRDELLGKNDYDFFPRAQADAFTAKDRSVLMGAEVVDIPEEPLETRQGTRFLHTKKIPLFDRSGNPQYLLGISEDITAVKAAEMQRLSLIREQAARAAAERAAENLAFLAEVSAALSETLDVGRMLPAVANSIHQYMAELCVFDLQATHSNAVERYQFSLQTLAGGRPWPPAFPIKVWERPEQAEDSAVVASKNVQLLQNPSASELERFGIWNDGPVYALIVLPLQTHGPAFGTLVLANLREGRVYSELDLTIAQDLARRISFAFDNARLYIRAQDANRAKSSFLANMSHEIRTPLGAILGFADLLSYANNLNAEQEDFLATISRNGRELLRIVDEILDLSKIESDRIEVEVIPFSLHRLLNDVMSLLRFKAADKGLKLQLSPLQDVPDELCGDPMRLRQILINVLGNAIKFTAEGSVQLDLYCSGSDGDAEQINFLISDTGIGMSEEQQLHLFEPFSQADSSTSRRYGGTGLGLFLSKRFAGLLGGDLTLKASAPSEGSEFLLRLPLLRALTREHSPRLAAELQQL